MNIELNQLDVSKIIHILCMYKPRECEMDAEGWAKERDRLMEIFCSAERKAKS